MNSYNLTIPLQSYHAATFGSLKSNTCKVTGSRRHLIIHRDCFDGYEVCDKAISSQ